MLRRQSAGTGERFPVETGIRGEAAELVWRAARMTAATAADDTSRSSCARGLSPRFNAPMTDVVMPDECQSIPITAPSAWNQNGSLRRDSNADVP